MSIRQILSLLVPLLAAALALSSHPARAATPARAKPDQPGKTGDAVKSAPPADFADFAKLSGSRARACAAPPDARLAPLGVPPQRTCAWSGRLELSYWPAVTAPAGACLPPAAIAWHRLNAAVAGAPPWNTAAPSQSRILDNGAEPQALAVWRDAGGNWSAALWRWRPADGADTRAWEARHWRDVVRAAQALAAPRAAPPTPLQLAWLDASAGRPRVQDGDAWRWIGDGACLTLRAPEIKPGQSQLHWSRDDARLEQRTGMQVQLARRMPQAEWLQPFALLDPTVPGKRTGAKFTAIWKEGDAVQGQLWIPLRDGSGVVRARISAAAAVGAAPVGAALTAIAHAWEVRHE